MQIIKNIKDLKKTLEKIKNSNKIIGFVPTMGCIHEGHLSLIDISKQNSDITIASIFVNKAQFAAHEDLESYPREQESDLKKFESRNVDITYIPEDNSIYPEGFSTSISLGDIALVSEGKLRPQFFNGIALIMTKLFMIIQPNLSVFGEKDFQQLFIVRKLVRELNIPVKILNGPTIREVNGLAMASRNTYLSEEELKIAPFLYKSLVEAKNCLLKNDNIGDVLARTKKELLNNGFKSLDYLEIRDSNFKLINKASINNSHILISATLGKTRLLDNIRIE